MIFFKINTDKQQKKTKGMFDNTGTIRYIYKMRMTIQLLTYGHLTKKKFARDSILFNWIHFFPWWLKAIITKKKNQNTNKINYELMYFIILLIMIRRTPITMAAIQIFVCKEIITRMRVWKKNWIQGYFSIFPPIFTP